MRLAQVSQPVRDLARAVRFYERVLGAPALAVYDPPGIAFFDLDGARLMLSADEGGSDEGVFDEGVSDEDAGGAGGARGSRLYLVVDDVPAALERWRSAGALVVGEPHVIFRHEDDTLGPAGHDEWQAFAQDSEGNTVGLVGWEVAPAG